MSLASSLYETLVFDSKSAPVAACVCRICRSPSDKRLRFLHQRIWNADLADVVQARSKIDRFARVIRLAERLREKRREFCNAIAMLAGGVVSHFSGERDLLKQIALLGAGRLRGDLVAEFGFLVC